MIGLIATFVTAQYENFSSHFKNNVGEYYTNNKIANSESVNKDISLYIDGFFKIL